MRAAGSGAIGLLLGLGLGVILQDICRGVHTCFMAELQDSIVNAMNGGLGRNLVPVLPQP